MNNKSDWRNWNVAITGINARSDNPGPGCAVARSIKESRRFRGRLIGLGYDVLDAGLYNREIFESGYLIPYPASGEHALLERIQEIHAVEPIDAIIPCLDSEMVSFIRIGSELSELGIRMLIPDREQLMARAKSSLPELCQSVGLDTPEIRTISDPRFFESFNDFEDNSWQFPIMLKGIFYDAQVVYSREEARAVFGRLVSTWGFPVLAQKLVKGDEYNLTAIGDGTGSMYGEVMMRKRAITEKGKAWAGVTMNDPDMKEAASLLVQKLKWKGPFELEAMRGSDGRLNIIEINPRFPSWIYTTTGVGRNLPLTLLQMLADDYGSIHFDPPRCGMLFVRYAEEMLVELSEFESVFVKGSAMTNRAVARPLEYSEFGADR